VFIYLIIWFMLIDRLISSFLGTCLTWGWGTRFGGGCGSFRNDLLMLSL
jgi:hypothetical protein